MGYIGRYCRSSVEVYPKLYARSYMSTDLFLKSFISNPCPMAISEVADGKYIEVNNSLVQTLGYLKEEVIGKTTEELGIFVDINERKKAIHIMKTLGYLRNFETLIRCKDNTIINGVFNAEFITIQGNLFLLTVMNDITAKRQLEHEVIRLEKLHLIAQMSAGISHEVRNPMTTVRGFLQLLMKKPEYAHHIDYFELMISELDRANIIISDFLSITQSNPLNYEYVLQDLNTVLGRIKPLIQADALEKNCQLLYCLSETPQILLNAKEIHQMVLNFSRNSFDAMPSGGTLTVKTFHQNNHVILAVQDQGKGIDKAILGKLGTPFLTTKSNGTGLGLAVCYGIAHRHKAKIEVKTGSHGTTFEVHFPTSDNPA